jgi:hypothetical protein
MIRILPSTMLLGVCLACLVASSRAASDIGTQADADTAVATVDTAAMGQASTVLLPVIGYTPDTGLMLGVAALRFFYLEPGGADTRPSVFSPTFIYTLKNQIMVFLGTEFHWDRGRSNAGVFPSYVKFPDQFYGIGREVSLEDEENYTPERIAVGLRYNREVLGELRLGAEYRFTRHRLDEIEPDGQLASGRILGTDESSVSLPAVTLSWDTRDNIWSPERGLWLQLKVGISSGTWGSDYDFNQFTVDFRGYRALGKNTVWAAQLLATGLDGDPPFFTFPRLGGEEGLRGYRGGLYLDKTRVLGRVEYRREGVIGRFGGVLFGGIGDVAAHLDALTLAGNLWTAGLGVRYLWDEREKLKVRLDYGWGNGDSGFYLSLGEAF